MVSEFDPYQELLDIRSAERPPDHYVLLGLPRFESDREKIDEAAGERMSALQEYANSEYLDASQRLLNEVSAARRCLLNATKKIAYDEDLRTRQRRSSASAGGQRSGSKSGRRRPPLMPLGVACGVVAVLGLIFFLSRPPAPEAGNLVVDWPISERGGAAILVDGRAIPVPEAQPMYLKIAEGRHRVVFQRTGYHDIPKTLQFTDARVRLKLAWVPIGP